MSCTDEPLVQDLRHFLSTPETRWYTCLERWPWLVSPVLRLHQPGSWRCRFRGKPTPFARPTFAESLWSLGKSSRTAKIRRWIWLGVTVFILRQSTWQVFAPMVAGRWVSNCLPWRKDFVFSVKGAWWGMGHDGMKHNPFRDNNGIL